MFFNPEVYKILLLSEWKVKNILSDVKVLETTLHTFRLHLPGSLSLINTQFEMERFIPLTDF